MKLTEEYIKENSYWSPKITQQILAAQKLRELIEELTDGDFQTITRAFGTSGIYTSIQLIRILDIFNRLQKLLEEPKQ